VERGGMAKAAVHLNISQPAVSKAIAALENTLRVRLLDRNPQGVEPTVYGLALLDGGVAVFDELIKSVKQIEHLTDPHAGDLRGRLHRGRRCRICSDSHQQTIGELPASHLPRDDGRSYDAGRA
jgi:DNA-binding transcriptional LysR family regulator